MLIKLLNVFQSASSATRPSEAGTAEGGVSLGKKMKEEEYYLAIWGNGEDGTGEVSCQAWSKGTELGIVTDEPYPVTAKRGRQDLVRRSVPRRIIA